MCIFVVGVCMSLCMFCWFVLVVLLIVFVYVLFVYVDVLMCDDVGNMVMLFVFV